MSNFKFRLLPGMLLFVAFSAHGAFYKWVDANGVTQYSQNPPSAGEYQEIRSAAPASPANTEAAPAPTLPAKQDPAGTAADSPPPDAEQLARHQAIRAQNCRLATARLAQLENHARIRYTAADGSVRVMGEDEKQAKLAETRKMMSEMCQ